ncbi:MAG: hypothetical protein E7576_17020 [Ruminococcaceae bacterium]|nr:hypothetical protein [Oscillospiraceae bacterium]
MKGRLMISVLTGILAAGSMLALFGCGKRPSGEIVSAWISVSRMDYGNSYSFSLAETEEGVFLSCDEDNGEGRLELDHVKVPASVLGDFRQAVKDTGFEKSVLSGRKAHNIGVLDATSRKASFTWENGAEKMTSVKPEGEEEIRSFLSKAARAYGIPEEEAGELKYLSVSASASWIEGSFSFDFREEDGAAFLSAYFIFVTEADGDWEEHTVELDDRPLSDAQTDEIRAAARESGLYSALAASSARWESPAEDEEELMPLDATTYHLSAYWEKQSFSDSGWGDPHYEPLLSVLKEIARTLDS